MSAPGSPRSSDARQLAGAAIADVVEGATSMLDAACGAAEAE